MEAFNYFPHTCSEKKHFYSPFYCLLVFVRLPRKYSRYPFILWLHKTQKDWYAQKNNTNFRSHMGLDKHTADMQPQRANPVCWNMSEGAHPSEPWSYLAPLEKKASGSPPHPPPPKPNSWDFSLTNSVLQGSAVGQGAEEEEKTRTLFVFSQLRSLKLYVQDGINNRRSGGLQTHIQCEEFLEVNIQAAVTTHAASCHISNILALP